MSGLRLLRHSQFQKLIYRPLIVGVQTIFGGDYASVRGDQKFSWKAERPTGRPEPKPSSGHTDYPRPERRGMQAGKIRFFDPNPLVIMFGGIGNRIER